MPAQDHPDSGIAGVSARQQGSTRWATHRTVGVPVCEPNAVLRHTVEIRRPEVGRSHARQIAVALVIREKNNDVRSFVWHF